MTTIPESNRRSGRIASGNTSRIVSATSPRSLEFLRISPRRASPGSVKAAKSGKKIVTRRASVSMFGNFLGSIRRRKNIAVAAANSSSSRIDFDRFPALPRAASPELERRVMENFANPKVLRMRNGIEVEESRDEELEIDFAMGLSGIDSPGVVQPNPFTTPPHSPTRFNSDDSSPMSDSGYLSSPESTRRRRNARLMSRMKTVQVLGVEASEIAAQQWMVQNQGELGW